MGKERLLELGFDIPRGKIMARQALMLNRVEEGLPYVPRIAKADDIELQEITKNAVRSMENLMKQFKWQETLPEYELQGLDKHLRSIRVRSK